MAKRKLNYRFYNPNPVEVTADYILKVMIEANTEKVEKAIRVKMQTITEKKYNDIQKKDALNKLIWYNILTDMDNGGERCGKE